jgi:hypothetical protein
MSARPSKFRYAGILIVTLLVGVVAHLLSISDTLTLFFGTLATCTLLAIFASEAVERRIAEITRISVEEGKPRPRRYRFLNLPRNWLIHATHLWGFATLLFGLQFAVQVGSSDLGYSNPSDIFLWGGLLACAMAGFQTYRICEFIMNPRYVPRLFPVYAVFSMIGLFLVDTAEAYGFLLPILPIWNFIDYAGKLFVLLLVVSITASIPFWLGLNGKVKVLERHWVQIAIIFFSPFILILLTVVTFLIGIRLP